MGLMQPFEIRERRNAKRVGQFEGHHIILRLLHTMKMFFRHHTSLSPILLLLLKVAIASSSLCRDQEWEDHPTLCRMVDRAENDVEALALEMHEWARAHGMLAELEDKDEPSISDEIATSRRRLGENQLPVVFAHGMGDSCFNDGMQRITAKVSEMLGGVYTVCVPTGETHSEDTKNGYFLSMDANVDLFAEGYAKTPTYKRAFMRLVSRRETTLFAVTLPR
jgi:hypothetical protein